VGVTMREAPQKFLSEIIPNIDPQQNCQITGLSLDTRTLQPGNVFFAYPGTHSDGRDHINTAIEKKASAIIIEPDSQNEQSTIPTIPTIPIKNLRSQISSIASNYYNTPSRKLNITAITGTNGKSTIAYALQQCLSQNNISTAMVGTLGYGTTTNLKTSTLTTPDAIQTQALLAEFLDQNITHVIMEASSHALDQHRLSAIDINHAIFTNLSHEHLDYHGNLQHYGEAKEKLFSQYTLSTATINQDDEFGQHLTTQYNSHYPIYTYSTHSNNAKISAHNIQLTANGISAEINTPWGEATLQSPLLGLFNLSNLLATLSQLNLLKIPFQQTINALQNITHIPGRMQAFGGNTKPHVFIDFAHTPDALKNALITLQTHFNKPITVIFGCGGERDTEKRSQMGSIASRFCERIILTDDNPRSEDPAAIINQILSGITDEKIVTIEHDRKLAIQNAINNASPSDIILIAGKGIEHYQIIGSHKYEFSDIMTVQNVLG